MNHEEYVDSLIKNIPLGIVVVDTDGYIKNANSKLLDMFGYKFNEIIEQPISNIFQDHNKVKNLLLSQHHIIDEEVYVNARKNRLRFNLSAHWIGGTNDEILDAVYIFNDIKKDRKLANKLTRSQAIYTFDKIIGVDRSFKRLIEFSKKIADSKSTILITGESGTGKEVFAQAIHNYSNRKDEPFIAINSAAIPKSLVESELFGYEEGAFTGAKKQGHPGKFEIADKGTVFLDEIGEMPYDVQARLLRVIEEGTISRIGSIDQKIVDIRIIAASNRNLEKEVVESNFRKDLFYRLKVLPIEIPPLRKRREDIPLLIDYFMKKISERLNKKRIYIDEKYMEQLIDYEWPGNVRELENYIELMINMEQVPNIIWKEKEISKDENIEYMHRDLSLDHVEKQQINKVLKLFSGNITKSARALGIGRNTLYRKIKKHEIDCSEIEHCSEIEQE